jgi:hypothetical protein
LSSNDSGKTSNSGTAATALSVRFAHEIVKCDPAVLSLIVVGRTGEVLAVERSPRLDEPDYLGQETVKKLGLNARLMLEAAENASDVFGKTMFLVGAFKDNRVLLMNLPEYQVALALRLERSANVDYIHETIRDILGTA